MAAQLGGGERVGGSVSGGYHVGDGFGLGEVEFACEESPYGELSCLRRAGAVSVQRAQDFGDYPAGTVAGYLRHVFPRVRCGGAKDRDEDFVDEIPFAVRKIAVMYRSSSLVPEQFSGGRRKTSVA